ncbi:uncharacterized protein M6G45_009096 [Spheniscus humboldti]
MQFLGNAQEMGADAYNCYLVPAPHQYSSFLHSLPSSPLFSSSLCPSAVPLSVSHPSLATPPPCPTPLCHSVPLSSPSSLLHLGSGGWAWAALGKMAGAWGGRGRAQGEGQGLSDCIWLWFAWAVSGLALLAAWAKRDTWTTTGFGEELLWLKLKKPEKDDGIGSAYRASQLDPGYEPWGRPRDVARGRAFPRLNLVLDPSWHPKEMDRGTLQKQAFQKGSSHTVPVSDEEREAMQETGTPGADAGKKAEAADREELRKYYIPGTAAALGVLLSGVVVSCIVISRRRKRDP